MISRKLNKRMQNDENTILAMVCGMTLIVEAKQEAYHLPHSACHEQIFFFHI